MRAYVFEPREERCDGSKEVLNAFKPFSGVYFSDSKVHNLATKANSKRGLADSVEVLIIQ